MVMRGAMALRLRSMSAARTMAPVAIMALRGSPDWVRLAKIRLAGRTLWDARACMMRCAPTTEERAEEKVAPKSPARMAGPQAALSTMMVYCPVSSSTVALAASQ